MMPAVAVAIGFMPVTAKADPAFGFGVSFIFGGDVAIGVRVFSDDRPERGALALGLDYKTKSKSFRPSVGAAYLEEDFYVDLSLGLDLKTQDVDYGIGLGLTSNVESPAVGTTSITSVPTPPPIPTPGA
ncbi:MAG: hypothetical protein ACU0A6_16080 [Shimia sp.]|uniref:hypothetical protein n=1 Tax=Shimia sp. TaxID=1954381 RepID=UPI00405902B7